MPTLSRCFLRGGLICLAVGMLFGGLILFQKGAGTFPYFWVLLPAHTYLVLVGGVSQFALGVSYWIFPRLRGNTHDGRRWLAHASYGTLNAAIALIVLHPVIQSTWGQSAAHVAFISAGILQSLAALTFVLHIWPRIRGSEPIPRRPA